MTTATAGPFTADVSLPSGTDGERMRVLFVCYHFPPMMSTGAHRVARFARDLPEHVDVDVLTVSNPTESMANTELFDELPERVTVYKAPVLGWLTMEQAGQRFRGRTRSLPSRILAKVSKTLLSLFAWIPDRQIAWYPGAVAKGTELLAAKQYDLIFCSSPPHSLHLVGQALKRRSGVPLVVDFRDPWSGNPQRKWASPIHRVLEKRMEARLLREADAVIANTPGNKTMWLEDFEGLHSDKVFVITNGFDPERRDVLAEARRKAEPRPHDSRKRIVYTGHLYDGGGNVLRAYKQLVQRDPSWVDRVILSVVGSMDPGVELLARELEALGAVETHGRCPSHELPRVMVEADAVLYVVPPHGWHWIPSKVYDYLLLEKPILSVLPRGDAWNLLESSGLAELIEDGTLNGVTQGLERALTSLCDGTLEVRPRAAAIGRYDGRALTGHLYDVFQCVLTAAKRH